MRTAPDQPSNERTSRPVPTTGVAPTTPLAAQPVESWISAQGTRLSAAAIPLLLNSVAWGDPDTASAALGDLRKRICQYGFVVEQATAATVPFLWELAQLPQVTCRAEIIQLLRSIAGARQWESTAAVYPKLLNHRENPVVWERQARQAVRAKSGVLSRLMADDDSEIAHATTELARTLDE